MRISPNIFNFSPYFSKIFFHFFPVKISHTWTDIEESWSSSVNQIVMLLEIHRGSWRTHYRYSIHCLGYNQPSLQLVRWWIVLELESRTADLSFAYWKHNCKKHYQQKTTPYVCFFLQNFVSSCKVGTAFFQKF